MVGMAITASALRSDVYNILDRVLDTGEAVTIERNGRELKIVPVDKPSKLEKLVARPDFIVGDPEDLVHVDWSHEWNPDPL